MDLQAFPGSPRADLVSPQAKFVQSVPPLFPAGDMDCEEDGEWFFNMKVHHPPHQTSPPGLTSPRRQTLKHLDHAPAKAGKASRHGHKTPREQTKTSRDHGGGEAGKPLFNRHRKLEAMATPSPAELREKIDIQTARSIGDSLIFHNIPERCEDTPEAEVRHLFASCTSFDSVPVGSPVNCSVYGRHISEPYVKKGSTKLSNGCVIASTLIFSLRKVRPSA